MNHHHRKTLQYSVAFSHAQHSLPTDEVAQVRRFRETCGIDPDQFPL